MSLFFLHPIYLYGLIAASVPLLIHLLNRRRLKRIRFPAVRFILLSQRRIARSYRLRHWILLALRTLAILLLALLLAHPIFQTGAGLFAAGGPFSLAVILDNSLSMRWSREGAGFKEAKEAVRLFISALKEGDRAAIIPTNGPARGPTRLRGDRGSLRNDLDSLRIGDGSADFSHALGQAYELLREPAAQKEIWLVTDMALTGWDRYALSSLKHYDPLIPLKIIKVEKRGEPLNATIKEVALRGREVGVGVPIPLEARIVNFSDKEIKDLLVQLYVDEQKREQRLVSLPPKGELAVGFQLRLARAGAHQGYVMLKKEGLSGNPVYYFTLQAQERLKVLAVDGDPQTSLVQSETFFLTRALNPAGERDGSLFLPTVVLPEKMNSLPLDDYQAIILCNVPALSDAALLRLRDYLRRGGGVLIFLGDRVQMDDYNLKLFQSSPPLISSRLREKRLATDGAGEKIGKLESRHPALRALSDPLLRESLQSTRVRGYFRAEAPDGTSLIALANGDPLLSEKRLGAGRVLFFATSADRDWSDLPLKTAYLPLIQSLVSYLAGSRGSMDGGIAVGGAKTLSFAPSYVGQKIKIIKPDKAERIVGLAADGETVSASFQENDLAGIYRISLPSGEKEGAPPLIYPANPPYLESRLDPIGERELRAKLQPIRTEFIPLESLEKGGSRVDLALPLLFLLIVALALEGWLAQRF